MLFDERTWLVAAALFPAVALCIYVFKKDRMEKEPLSLLLVLLALGAVSCMPAAFFEGVLSDVLVAIFSNFDTMEKAGIQLTSSMYEVYLLCDNFIGVALVEEGLKWCCLLFVTRKSRHFNSLFDGLIYAVFVSLGFAGVENVLYVTQYGWINALTRAVLSVPGHMFFGVMMGYYYSMWHMNQKARGWEIGLRNEGVISSERPLFGVRRFAVLSLLIPVLGHGWYDYCCSTDFKWATTCLVAFVAFLYAYCFGKINRMSRADMKEAHFVGALLLKKYPDLRERVHWEGWNVSW